MNETKQQSSNTRNISQSTNLPTHLANSNGLPTSCSASTSAQINHHTFTTPTKNDNIKSQQPSQPQTPQFKTLQLIPSSSNHLVSASQGNCVVVQQVSNSNHSVNFQQLSSPEHSQNQSGQTIYRQKNQTFVNARTQQPATQANSTTVNQNGEGNGTNVQQTQISARYVHHLQDGRQLQMIQIPNNTQYVQLSNAPGQNGQPSQIMTYVHPQQQQFVTRNGGQTQNVIIASQAQDGSRTLQTVPAQIHTIQHTVSPQNASFHLTKSSLKNVKQLNPSTQSQKSQNRKPEFVQSHNNGTQNTTSNQSQTQNNSDGQSSQSTPQKTESPKVRSKTAKTTPNKPKPKIIKSSPQTHQITNNVGQPTATIQQIALPVNAQIRAPTPNIKGKEKGQPTQVRTVAASFVQNQQPSSQPVVQQQQQPQNCQQIQENSQKVQRPQIVQQQQQVPANAVVQTVQKTVQVTQQIVQKSEPQQNSAQQGPSGTPANPPVQTIIVQQNQTQVSTTVSSQTTVQTVSQAITTAKIPAVPTVVKAPRSTASQSKPSIVAESPVPNDPYSGALSKLNLDLTGGDPKDSYRILKKHFKFLVYENECYQGQLRDSHQRLLKLERDNNYLMDRLLKYETLSDSDGDESDSSIKTIQDKALTQKTTKKRPANKKDSSAPPRKKANVTSKANAASNNSTPLPKVNPTTSKAAVSTASKPSTVKPVVSKEPSGAAIKPSTSSTAILQSNSNTSTQSTSSSTLSVFQANMPLPSVYKPFPPSNTSTVSTPSTPTTTDTSFVTPALPKTNGPMVTKKPVVAAPKLAPPKAKVIIADLPKQDNRSKPPHVSPTTSTTSSCSTASDIPEPKVYTVVSRAPILPRNPTPQSNATVTYSTLKPNAMIPRPMGQMPTQTRMHPPRPKIQIIQPSPMNQPSQQYNIQQNSKLRPQLKENSTIKKESPPKPTSS